MKTKEELNALKEEAETQNKKLHELTEEELAQVSGGSLKSKCKPVSADSTTCYWLTHLIFGDKYRPLDESKPQTCGNCFYFNPEDGCISRSSGC